MSNETFGKAMKTLRMKLYQIEGKVIAGTKKALEEEAIFTRDLAQSFTPVKTGALQSSIEWKEVSNKYSKYGKFEVFVNSNIVPKNEYVKRDGTVSVYPLNGGTEKRVGSYAWEVHERVAPKGPYPGSKSTQADPEVGGGYLERAFEFTKEHAISSVSQAVKSVLANSDFYINSSSNYRKGGGR